MFTNQLEFKHQVLGYMSKRTNVPIKDLAVSGPGLSFQVYPEALALMPLVCILLLFFFRIGKNF